MFTKKFKIFFISLIFVFLYIEIIKIENEKLQPCPSGSKNLLARYSVFSQRQSLQPPIKRHAKHLRWIKIQPIYFPESSPCDCKFLFLIHSDPENVESRNFLRNFIFTNKIKQRVGHYFYDSIFIYSYSLKLRTFSSLDPVNMKRSGKWWKWNRKRNRISSC